MRARVSRPVILTALLAAVLLVIAPLVLSRTPAHADPNGQLAVRAYSVLCGFTNIPNEPNNQCADDPDEWYPSETANAQLIEYANTGVVPACQSTVTQPVIRTADTSSAGDDLECNGRTHSTASLLASIFTGVDADGHPDVPASTPWPAGASGACSVTNNQVADAGAGTCGVAGTNRSSAQWYIMEGYVSFPAAASGEVRIRATNVGNDGVPRAEYMAFMVSDDATYANLHFVGGAQTAFRVNTGFAFPVAVSDDLANTCASDIRAVRMYMFDNIDGSSATLQWDVGNGFEAIPSDHISTDPRPVAGCLPPTATNNAETTPQGVPVDIDVATDDVPGSAPLVPSTVRLTDPETSDPVTSVTIDGEGTWTVDTTTGVVTFAPVPEFFGETTPVGYQITDENGLTAKAEITVTVEPTPPTATNNAETTPQGVPVDIDVATDDVPGGSALIPSSVRLIDPESGDPVTSVTVDGEGTWTVDTTTGVVTFAPEPEFTGVTTAVGYQITDQNGLTAEADITVTVTPKPVVTPTPTPSVTPTVTPTPAVTPTVTPPPAVTPTATPTPSVTPTLTVTPTTTTTPTSTPTAGATTIPSTPPPTSGLAATGSPDAAPLVGVGLVVVLAGVLLSVVRTRRAR